MADNLRGMAGAMGDGVGRGTIRVGVLDNDSLTVECMRALLGRLNRRDGVELDVWGTCDTAMAIHRCCFDPDRTDVLFLDMALSGIDGVQVCRTLREMRSDSGVVGMTSYDPDTYRIPLRNAGGQALLDKSRLSDVLADALFAVADGECYPADSGFPTVAQSLAARHDDPVPKPLTFIEQRVIAMTLGGMSAGQIARELGIAESTVFSHHRNIKQKMGKRTWADVLNEFRFLHLF